MNNEIEKRKLAAEELATYKSMANLTKFFLDEFDTTSTSDKYNEIKKFYLDLSYRIVSPAERDKEIRTDDISKINIQLNRNIELFENYKINWLDKNDNSALEQIRKEMTAPTNEAAQINVRKNR